MKHIATIKILIFIYSCGVLMVTLKHFGFTFDFKHRGMSSIKIKFKKIYISEMGSVCVLKCGVGWRGWQLSSQVYPVGKNFPSFCTIYCK
jgi:hypothetical protein